MRQIDLVPYNTKWPKKFESEVIQIRQILGGNCCDVQHVGSTAVIECYAKPVIDILAIINDLSTVDCLNSEFEKLGYDCVGEFHIPKRRFYLKKNGMVHTYHIHLFEKGHHEIKRHLAFRDYLNQHKNYVTGYSWIKRFLAEEFPHSIKSYITGKESFIRMIDYQATTAKKDQLEAQDNIVIEPYDSRWPKLAVAEINAIKNITNLSFITIEHLGSTSVEGLSAKPVIDIFISLKSMDEIEQWINPLKALGYVHWADNPNKQHQRFFKGMPPYGIARTHHVHIMPMGNKFKRRVAFRDALRQEAALRQKYEELKLSLAHEHPEDRELYTDAKGSFITKILGEELA